MICLILSMPTRTVFPSVLRYYCGNVYFFRNCCKINNTVLSYVYDTFGRQDLQNCMMKLRIDDLYVHNMSDKSIRLVMIDNFVHSLVN